MHILKNEQGVTLVFIGLLFFLMLLFLGVAVDIGWTTYARGQAQRRVDAAALAAGSALICPTTFPYNGYTDCDSYRAAKTQARADLLASATVNNVINTSTNPSNTVTAMSYNTTTHALTTATGWSAILGGGTNCNAVKVTNAVPTPLFFSSIRNVFGASETGSMTIHVDATAYVGCPGTEKPTLPLAFCHDAVDPTNTGTCDVTHAYQTPDNNSAFFTPSNITANASNCSALVNNPSTMPNISSGDSLNLNNGQLTSCLQDIKTQCTAHSCSTTTPWCVLVPVVGGTCNTPMNGSRSVLGFAEFCITQVKDTGSPKYIAGKMTCPASVTGGPGGTCFGTAAQSPVLVN